MHSLVPFMYVLIYQLIKLMQNYPHGVWLATWASVRVLKTYFTSQKWIPWFYLRLFLYISHEKICLKWPSWMYLVTSASVRVLKSLVWHWKRIFCPHFPILWYIAWRFCKKYLFRMFLYSALRMHWPFDLSLQV